MFLRKSTQSAPRASPSGTIADAEFGDVIYKRTSSRYIRARVNEQGSIVVTMPRYARLSDIRAMLEGSRETIRSMRQTQLSKLVIYNTGMQIGHSHSLVLQQTNSEKPSKKLAGQQLTITLPTSWSKDSGAGREFIVKHIKLALRKEAEAYLPRRLAYLAEQHGFAYARIRYGNPKGRWGSCSSTGTISLNVALMNVPHEVIDYVLVHELVHTKHMNHSREFWTTVERCMPRYKEARRLLKTLSPVC